MRIQRSKKRIARDAKPESPMSRLLAIFACLMLLVTPLAPLYADNSAASAGDTASNTSTEETPPETIIESQEQPTPETTEADSVDTSDVSEGQSQQTENEDQPESQENTDISSPSATSDEQSTDLEFESDELPGEEPETVVENNSDLENSTEDNVSLDTLDDSFSNSTASSTTEDTVSDQALDSTSEPDEAAYANETATSTDPDLQSSAGQEQDELTTNATTTDTNTVNNGEQSDSTESTNNQATTTEEQLLPDPCILADSLPENDSGPPLGTEEGSTATSTDAFITEADSVSADPASSTSPTSTTSNGDGVQLTQTTYTDDDVDPNNPILQQSATVTSTNETILDYNVDQDSDFEVAPNASQSNSGCNTSSINATSTDSTVEGENEEGQQTTVNKDELEQIVEIINKNNASVQNDIEAAAVSGRNALESGDEGVNGLIDTGQVNIFANIVNVLNVNLVNSELTEIADNFENLTQDIVLNHPETTSRSLTQNLAEGVCKKLTCTSLASYALSNENQADVVNNVGAEGISGENAMHNFSDSRITSGDVNVVVNILNIVNTNLVNAKWTIATINVFGDWTGDLRLPSELYFMDHLAFGLDEDQALNVEDVHKVIVNVDNDNEVDIENNIDTNSDSGRNEIESFNEGAEVSDSNIASGEADATSYARNVVNTNVINGTWFLALVNTVGNWSGGIYSLPDSVEMGTTGAGFAFYSVNTNDEAVDAEAAEEFGNAFNTSSTTLDIINRNQARIINNVDLDAISGANRATSDDDLTGLEIQSGNTNALATLLNFVNTNVVNGELFFGVVNVFGNWNGNIVFGYPDLAVSQVIKTGSGTLEPGERAKIDLAYQNVGDGSSYNVNLDWSYDSSLFNFVGATAAFRTNPLKPGQVQFSLGRLTPNATGTVSILLDAIGDEDSIETAESFAEIKGLGIDKNSGNNNSLLTFSQNTHVEDEEIEDIPPVFEAPIDDTPEEEPAGNSEENNPENPGDENNEESDNGSNEGNNDQGGQNEQPSGQNNNPPPSGGGTGPGSQAFLMKVYSRHNAGTSQLKPDDIITFEITLDNDGLSSLDNVIVYDEMTDPSGKIIASQGWPVGTFQSGERVVIEYSIAIENTAPTGKYQTRTWAQGRNFNLNQIKTTSDAITYFNVQNPDWAPENTDESPISQVPGAIDSDTGNATGGENSNTEELEEELNDDKTGALEEKPAVTEPETVSIVREQRPDTEVSNRQTGLLESINPKIQGAVAVTTNNSAITTNDDQKDLAFANPVSDFQQKTADEKGQGNNWLILILIAAFSAVTALYTTAKKRTVRLPAKKDILTLLLIAALLANWFVPYAEKVEAAVALSCSEPISIPFPYAIQSDEGGVKLDSFGQVTGSVYSNEDINGASFAKINGSASAHENISNVEVTGISTAGAATKALPAFNVNIWKQAAQLGETHVGDYIIAENSLNNTLGPIYIDGNLIVEQNSHTSLKSTIYVTGNIDIESNAKFELSDTFGSFGSVVIAEGTTEIDGNAKVSGNNNGGKLLIVSAGNSDSNAIDVDGNFVTQSVIFYALDGGVSVGANSSIIAAYGNKVKMGASSKVNYSSTLLEAEFVCPPPPLPASALTVTKTADVSQVEAGNQITYTITVKNISQEKAESVTISDELNANLEFVSASNPGMLVAGGQQTTWNIDTLPPASSVAFNLVAKVSQNVSATTTIPNVTTAWALNASTTASQIVDVTATPFVAAPNFNNIESNKTSSASQAMAGDNITYTINYYNSGNAPATDVVITDTLAGRLLTPTTISNSGEYATTTRTITWNIGSVAAGEAGSVSFNTTISTSTEPGTTIANTAFIGSLALPTINVQVNAPQPEPEPTSGGGSSGGSSSSSGINGGGPNYIPEMNFIGPEQNAVGNTVNEKLTITNTASLIPEGLLNITLPGSLEFTAFHETATTTASTTKQITLPVPALGSNETWHTDFSVMALINDPAALSYAEYYVDGNRIGFVSLTQEIIADLGGVGDEVPATEEQIESSSPQTSSARTSSDSRQIASTQSVVETGEQNENEETGQEVAGLAQAPTTFTPDNSEACANRSILFWVLLLTIIALVSDSAMRFVKKEKRSRSANILLTLATAILLMVVTFILWSQFACPGSLAWWPIATALGIFALAIISMWETKSAKQEPLTPKLPLA